MPPPRSVDGNIKTVTAEIIEAGFCGVAMHFVNWLTTTH